MGWSYAPALRTGAELVQRCRQALIGLGDLVAEIGVRPTLAGQEIVEILRRNADHRGEVFLPRVLVGERAELVGESHAAVLAIWIKMSRNSGGVALRIFVLSLPPTMAIIPM